MLKPVKWEPTSQWVSANKEKIRAIQAIYNGSANEGQQLMALNFIMQDLCERDTNQYHPSDRDTAFALGKKFVADHIAGAINVKLGAVKEPKQ